MSPDSDRLLAEVAMRTPVLQILLAAIAGAILIPSVARAVCGDGIVQAPEECDDGNVSSGDGCFSTCQLEDELVLGGVAEGSGGGGNNVKVWIFGLSARIFPSAGQSAVDVVADLAAEINADVVLSGIGVSSVAIADRLVTNGSITGLLIKDQGIVSCPASVPSLTDAWLVVLGAALCGSALWYRTAGKHA